MAADQSTLQRAIEAHKGGRLLEAEAEYRRILRRNPGDADALNFLGMLTCQTGDAVAAAELLRKSVEADSTNSHAWLNLGNVLLAKGDAQEARAAFVKATELAPDLPMAWFNLGVCLGRCSLPQEAASALQRALKLEPGHIPAYESLALLLNRLGNHAEAAEVYRDWLVQDPGNPIAKHMLAATAGLDAPARAEDGFVRQTFDNFASSFDENLKALDYRAPEWVTERLAREVPSNATLDILDAGCGTGLCAPLLKPLARRLVGVDLSSGMVDKARARELYDELVVQELSEFMRSRPGAYDVVVSADTLCYFGALQEPLAAARGCLRKGGILTFTLERLDPAVSGEPYRLETHGRYSHAEVYVRAAATQAGFHEMQLEERILRRERGQNVMGHVFLARAPAA
jgi:predicted TPR repeat methyltransferase